jgi:tetratricopeptide (TPR) repeat protein
MPLDSVTMPDGLRPSRVELHAVTKSEAAQDDDDENVEPLMAPRGVSQDRKDSARGLKAGAPTPTGGAAPPAAPRRSVQESTGQEVLEATVGPEVKRLGFAFTTPNRTNLCVKNVAAGLWAEEVGVEVGDEILEINGKPTNGMAVEQVKQEVAKRPLVFRFRKKALKEAESKLDTQRSNTLATGTTPRTNRSSRSESPRPEDVEKEKAELEAELKVREERVGREAPELEPLLTALARIYGRLEESTRHKELLERILRILEKTTGPDVGKKRAAALKDLSTLYARQEDHAQRQALLEQAYEIEEREYGPENEEVAVTRARLANACGKNGDMKRQVSLLTKSLPILERTDHADLVPILSNLGIACAATGEHTRAKEVFLRALDRKEKEKGKDHIQLTDILVGLAESHGNLQELKEQRSCLERALRIKEATYGPDDGKVAVTLANLGSVCRRMGDAKAAKDVFERTLAIKENEKQYGPDHPQVALTLANLAAAYGDLGETTKQRELVERALKIFEQAHGPDHPHTKLAKKMLAKIDRNSNRQGNPDNAPNNARSSRNSKQ